MLLILVNIYLKDLFVFLGRRKIYSFNQGIYSFSWLRNLNGIRRWASHDVLTEKPPG
jgi:hypothetical protein